MTYVAAALPHTAVHAATHRSFVSIPLRHSSQYWNAQYKQLIFVFQSFAQLISVTVYLALLVELHI